jgi:hypothetical protein
MKTELRKGEQVVKEGSANLQRNIETVGGKLYLTNQRIVFEAHKFNVQRGATEVELSNIQALRPCWTRQWGLFRYFPTPLPSIRNMEKNTDLFCLDVQHG